MGVLAELGVATPQSHEAANPGTTPTRRHGPCLIAGDGLAWRWALAFNMAPADAGPTAVAAVSDHQGR